MIKESISDYKNIGHNRVILCRCMICRKLERKDGVWYKSQFSDNTSCTDGFCDGECLKEYCDSNGIDYLKIKKNVSVKKELLCKKN